MPVRRAEDSVRLRAAFPPLRLPWQPHFLVFPRFFPLVASASNSTERAVLRTARKFTLTAFIVSANRYYRIRGVVAREIISNVRYCDFFSRKDNVAERMPDDGLSMEKCASTRLTIHLYEDAEKYMYLRRKLYY